MFSHLPCLAMSLALLFCLFTTTSVFSEEKRESMPKPGQQVAQELTFSMDTSGQGTANGEVTEPKKAQYHYWAFLPTGYEESSEKTWPLLIFLHGMGERGDDLTVVTKHGPPHLLLEEKYRSICPFIVISPQCPKSEVWTPRKLARFLDEIEKKYNVDKSRIYLTGLSMGGFGSWNWSMSSPDRFAAVVPICGGGDISKVNTLVNTPVWAFHGEDDTVVKLEASVKLVDAIKEAGGKKVKLTIYPGVKHDSWIETYNNMELYKWLLSHKKERE